MVQNLTGTYTNNFSGNESFVEKSKQLAKDHDWLYHCTTSENLLNILKSREFWLSNLKYVNDEEEAGRIDVDQYRNKFFVSSFTYDADITKEHWEEYGTEEKGVILGVRKEWFKRKAFILGGNKKMNDDFFKVHSSYKEALQYKIDQQERRRLCNPFYIWSFGFYQVIYDDDMVKNICSDIYADEEKISMPGSLYIPDVGGIIKSKQGVCKREGHPAYMKNWESEKEVRLKVLIQQMSPKDNGNDLHDGMICPYSIKKVAVPLNEEAFKSLHIKFSSGFKNKEDFMRQIENLAGIKEIVLMD